MRKRALGVATAIVWMALASASTSSQQATTGLVWDVTNGNIVGASSMAVGAIAQAAAGSVVQWGVVHFDEPTTAAGRRLSGTCLLVHDEYWETSDFPCTTVRERSSRRAARLVLVHAGRACYNRRALQRLRATDGAASTTGRMGTGRVLVRWNLRHPSSAPPRGSGRSLLNRHHTVSPSSSVAGAPAASSTPPS